MTDSQFNTLAEFYDQIMQGVPYDMWVYYLEDIFKRYNCSPKTILDVACGTGNVSETLAERGYQVTGIDLSEDMIRVAKSKQPARVDYYNQGIAQLDLDKRFDAAISLFDSLNYVLDAAELGLGMRKVWEHLVDGGLFIFDVNTIYALQNRFFDRDCLDQNFFPRYRWTSEYDKSTSICTVNMVFEALRNGKIITFEEVHRQRGYSIGELSNLMINAGFRLLDVFSAYTFKKPNRYSDRVFFVGRKSAK